jgi:hypothetical protein
MYTYNAVYRLTMILKKVNNFCSINKGPSQLDSVQNSTIFLCKTIVVVLSKYVVAIIYAIQW